MKTPHRIKLVRGDTVPKYNPETDSYEQVEGEAEEVACLVNFISQAKVFEAYGNRNEKVMICRFQQEQKPFQSATYEGSKYEPLDQIDAPIKGAVRLKKVGGT